MVTFEKDRYIITIETGINPSENWMQLHKSLCNIIRNVDIDNINEDFYAAVDFLSDMMPDWDTVKKMQQ